MQNVLADEAAYRLPLADERDFAGLPDYVRAAAREAAKERGVDTPGIITLSRSLIVPFLTFSDRRDLREQAYKAWTTRGEHDGPHDNRPIAREILALRNEQARLHGYRHYAEYALDDRMAGTPDAVARLLAPGMGAREGTRRRGARWRRPPAPPSSSSPPAASAASSACSCTSTSGRCRNT